MFMSSFTSLFAPPYDTLLLQGLRLTFYITVCSWVLAFVLGVALAMVRVSGSKIAEGAVAAYVAYQQNIPLLVHVLLWYFGVSTLLPWIAQDYLTTVGAEFIYPTLAIGFCMAAYFSEDLRSGLRAISPGQHEASRALGLSYFKTMRYIILPQALRISAPPFMNHTVLLFKSTSLAMAVGAAEMTYMVKEIESQTFLTFQAYILASVFYLSVSLGLMAIGNVLTNRKQVTSR